MEKEYDLSLIKEIIKRALGTQAKIAKSLSTGLFNTSYEIIRGEERFILRIAPSDDTICLFYEKKMMRQEPSLHILLKEKTSIPVPTIYHWDFTGKIIDRDYLIMEKLPGKPLSESSANYSGILNQIGIYLSELHSIKNNRYGYIGEHHPMSPQDNWFSSFRIMWKKLLKDINATGIYTNQDISKLEKLLQDNEHHFKENFPASLLHMDIWSQNILVEDNKVTGIVDWDRALWGDPEIEFAVLDYCGISESPFWEGYGNLRKKDVSSTIRWVFYFLYELQKYIVIYWGRRKNTQGALNYKTHTADILSQYMGTNPFKK